MRSSLWTSLFALSLMAACTTEPSGGDDGVVRGPIGKADAAGTCELPGGQDACGGKGAGACWCDDLCVDFGDCCNDAGAVCGIDDAGDGDAGDGGACSPVLCEIACPFGFDTNEDGCEVCQCHDPTGDFCGGIAAFQCPQSFQCVLDGDYPDAGGHCEPVPPPPPPSTPSCVDACGGPGPGGACWCDDLCEGFGDCCDDYANACVAAPPESCDDCGTDEVCVTRFTQLGPQVSCAPIAASCEGGEPSCACMAADVCTGVFDACSVSDDGLACSCPVC